MKIIISNQFILVIIIFIIISISSLSFSGEPSAFPPNITIIFPVNNTNYFTTNLSLNFTSNESITTSVYELDGVNTTISKYSLCYQETANSSTSTRIGCTNQACTDTTLPDGNCKINYNRSYANDGYWTSDGIFLEGWLNTWDGSSFTYGKVSFSFATGFPNASYHFENWTTPNQTLSGIILQSMIGGASGTKVFNNSLPLSYIYNNRISLMYNISGNGSLENKSTEFYYWDGLNYLSFFKYSNPSFNSRLYEISMYWNISNSSNVTLQGLAERRHNVSVYGLNSNNQIGQSSYVYFTINQTPQWSNNQTNLTSNTQLNDAIQLNITLTDNSNLSSYIFSWNVSGFWQNLTQINYTITTTNTTLIENRTINQSSGKLKAWVAYFNDTIGNRNQTDIFTFNIKNILPNATNVSITPLPLNTGTDARGHANYSDTDGDTAGGNQTYWYVNKTIINEANNSFTLLGGNVTTNSNITFSARFNDTFDWGNWINSSIVTAGDITAPTFKGNRTNPSSVQRDSTIDLFVNATDNIGVVDVVKAEINNTQIKTNFTMNLDTGSSSDGEWKYTYTTSVVGTHRARFYAKDGSGNERNTGDELTFEVTAIPVSSGGGGGGGATTIIIKEGIPLLSFGGLTLIDFNVLTTPSKKVKIIRFKNVGNVTFANAKASIEGDANKFVNVYICNLDLKVCMNESINIKAGESALLSLNGTFTQEIGKGTSGIIKIQEQKTSGVTYELNLLISRPPLYSIAIKPLASTTGIPELVAFVVVYITTAVAIIGSIWFITF